MMTFCIYFLVVWFFSAAFILDALLEALAYGTSWRTVEKRKVTLAFILAPVIVLALVLNIFFEKIDLELDYQNRVNRVTTIGDDQVDTLLKRL
jgi:hypothetical protein